jgi:hypothetical protein
MYRALALSALVASPTSPSLSTNGMGMLLVTSANVHSSNPRADAAMDRYATGDDTAFAELQERRKKLEQRAYRTLRSTLESANSLGASSNQDV